ncbi:unnamed protein product, partial [Mesorhabditis spiculigera]
MNRQTRFRRTTFVAGKSWIWPSHRTPDIIVLLGVDMWSIMKVQVAYRQGRWKSLNGMSIARSFLGIGYFGLLPSTK